MSGSASLLRASRASFNLGLGALPPGYSGYLTNDTTINAIGLVITTAPNPQPPAITSVSVQSGTNLVFSGTNGLPNGAYYVLTSTNVALPLSSWTRSATSNFDSNGNFSFSSPINPSVPNLFFAIQVP